MTKLINEDWEHAAYANDEMYRLEREYRMKIEYQEWDDYQKSKNKKPAIIKIENHETSHKSKSVYSDNKKGI
jgi:hypothetical protein